jgi:hypothetical protein
MYRLLSGFWKGSICDRKIALRTFEEAIVREYEEIFGLINDLMVLDHT